MPRPGFEDDAARMQASVLRSIKADLDLVIRPELKSDAAQTAAWLASEMLTYLAVGNSSGKALQTHLFEEQGKLLDSIEITKGGEPQPEVASELDLEVTHAKRSREVCRQVAALVASGDAAAPQRAFVDAAIQIEQENLEALERQIQDELVIQADPVAAVETPVTVERLAAWFAKNPAGVGIAGVRGVERVPGGYSKDTWRIALEGELAGHSQLILRRDLPFGPGENTVLDETALLHHLFAEGLPVPEPLASEADPGWLGTPFLLFPQLDGKAIFGDWTAAETEREPLLLELAEVMAQLHSLDPADAGFIPESRSRATPKEIVRDYIREWRDKWLRRRVHPSAILEFAFDWLLRHAPDDLPAARFVHGDISLRNTLIQAGRLEALLDWEFWHLGDPVEDLSYFRLVAEPYISWERFMGAYQHAGGCDYDEDRANFYAVWRSVRNSTTTTTAWHGFLSGAYPASKAAYQGIALYRLFLRDVAAQLAAVRA